MHVCFAAQNTGVPNTSSGATTAVAPPARTEVNVDFRETIEYKAALELEMWKEHEEARFEEQVGNREMMKA